MKGERNRTVMVYVDSYDNRIPMGRFHLASESESRPFQGICQFLLETNDYLNRENFPQAFTELRSFRNPQDIPRPAAVSDYPRGAMASFSIRFLFRQNASWQGTITWLEGNQQECFRSVLELIFLMDNALGYADSPAESL